MSNWLTRLFSSHAPQTSTEHILMLEQELQTLRLELAESERKADRLAQELARQQSSMDTQVNERLNSQIEKLMAELAAPAAQFSTQIYLDSLADTQSSEDCKASRRPQTQDVLAVARRMLRALQNHGLTPEEQPGERGTFDPDRHTVLSAEAYLQPGQAVKIQFAGFSYRGCLVHKAGVSPVESIEKAGKQ